MVADAFELSGWNGYFLGANTALAQLLRLADEKRPDIVAISLSMVDGMSQVRHMAEAVRDAFPTVSIWLGGQAFRWGGQNGVRTMKGVAVVEDLDELDHRLLEWPA
jgi:hypothetical protein